VVNHHRTVTKRPAVSKSILLCKHQLQMSLLCSLYRGSEQAAAVLWRPFSLFWPQNQYLFTNR